MKYNTPPPDVKFERHVIRFTDPDACWDWSGPKTGDNYGKFNSQGQLYYAHRFSWEQENGPIPDDLFCLHKCDNPICCNPRHLFLGTQADNMHDRWNKKRRGNMRQKLTLRKVKNIRAAYATGKFLQKELAVKYGIAKSNICKIINFRLWNEDWQYDLI